MARLEGLILEIRDLILEQNKLLENLILVKNKPPNKESNKENKDSGQTKEGFPQTPFQERIESSIHKDLIDTYGNEESKSLLDAIEISPSQKNKNKKSSTLNKEMYALVISWWNNEIAPTLNAPPLIRWTKNRQRKIFLRLKEFPNLLADVKEETNLIGKFVTDNQWLTFDWLMEEKNLTKFLEGTYRRKDARYVEQRPTQEELEEAFPPLAELRSREAGDNPISSTG